MRHPNNRKEPLKSGVKRLLFSKELTVIGQRFPDLINSYYNTIDSLDDSIIGEIFHGINYVFKSINEDVDDIISWSYQFLKKDLEKTAFKKLGKDKAKIENADLLFTTQFFTDKYMVKYLVDRSLSGFSKNNIKDVVVIDCASGGGNFLNYSFDKLFKIYKSTFPKWSTNKIVSTILNDAILGYDLDRNLSKIATLSLFVKASAYSIPSRTTQIRIYGGLPNDKLGFLNATVNSNRISNTTFKSQLDKINREMKVKVFVTNPPFMGKRDMDLSLKDFLIKNFPESKGDLCVSFFQKIINLMNEKDVLGIVSQNNWMYLSSLKDFRKYFMSRRTVRECVDLGSNAFEDINGEKTNVALCVVCNSVSTKFYNLKNCKIAEKKRLVTNKMFPIPLTFELNQSQFYKNQNLEFNYQLEHRFKKVKKLQIYSEFGHPMQGTSTGNNKRFVKFAWEVNGSHDWKLVSKGGGFSKWVGLNYYKVNWGDNAEKIKANKGSALRNIDKIPATQLVYSDTGTLGLNVRVLKENQVFIASGPGIQVLHGDKYAHLAFLNSRVATFLLKLINPKFTISAGYISKLPVAPNILNSEFLSTRSKKVLDLKEKYLQNKLPNIEFKHSDYSAIKNVNKYIEGLILSDIENDFERLQLESEIEQEIRKQYQFSTKELTEIRSVVGESPFFNRKNSLMIDFEQMDSLLSDNIDINCHTKSRTINGYSVGSESVLENLSFKLDVNPKVILDFITKNISLLIQTKAKYFNDLLHKIILKEIGIKQISIYKNDVINIVALMQQLRKDHTFLKDQFELQKIVTATLSHHHKISFFNKPLITSSMGILTVGQPHYG